MTPTPTCIAGMLLTETVSTIHPRNPLYLLSTVRKLKRSCTVRTENADRSKLTVRHTGARLRPPEVNGIGRRFGRVPRRESGVPARG
jgi:hypothetical protein